MIMQWIAELGAWNWFILGLVLLGVEILAPGTFFLWFGLSALVVGSVALLIDMPWQMELFAFGILAVALLILGRRYLRQHGEESDRPDLNRRALRYEGRVFTLDKPIVEGRGRLTIDDTIWRIEGPDLPAGHKVRVAGADGGRLIVAEAEA